jgi:hypothetical protein
MELAENRERTGGGVGYVIIGGVFYGPGQTTAAAMSVDAMPQKWIARSGKCAVGGHEAALWVVDE